MDSEDPKQDESQRPARVLKVGFLVFCVVVAAMLIAVLLVGEQGNLPFDYEGFD